VSREAVIGTIVQTGIVAVVRAESPRDLVELAHSLAKGDVRVVEITRTVPSALHVIEQAVAERSSEVIIGAGTVLDATTPRSAIAAGAGFIVGPSLSLEVIETAHLCGAASIPGCLTPTNIVQAWTAGADVVKLFPGQLATPGCFADLRGSFPHVRLMPTGNVDLKTTSPCVIAGAVAVGVGRALVDPIALKCGNWGEITARARRFRYCVDSARSTC
jgi:2-dehydro-3-deoxyphosphogluconate aldolase/(4S)-4-hydroxy-2-oxoglutarate aldolase